MIRYGNGLVGNEYARAHTPAALWHNTSSGLPEVYDDSGVGYNCCLGPTAFQVNFFQGCEDSFHVSLSGNGRKTCI
jgi:hypothetical protein